MDFRVQGFLSYVFFVCVGGGGCGGGVRHVFWGGGRAVPWCVVRAQHAGLASDPGVCFSVAAL